MNTVHPRKNRLFEQFRELSRYLESDLDMTTCLQDLTHIVADLLRAERCSIMLINKAENDELKLGICAHFGDLPEGAYDKPVELKSSISGLVFMREEPLLVDDSKNSEYGGMFKFTAKHSYDGFIITPILVSGSVKGVLNISRPDTPRRFTETDLDMAIALSFVVGQFIHIYQLNHLFKNKLATFSLTSEIGDESAEAVSNMVNNSDEVIKVLSKSLYKGLKREGINRDLILGSALEIVSLVARDLKKDR